MEVLRLERAVVLARKSKPAWGLRLNGPRERICFASSYFIPGFSGFSLFLDCDAEQLESTQSGNLSDGGLCCQERYPVHIRAPLFQTRSMDMNMRLSELGWVLPSGSPIYKNESWERAIMCVLFRLPDVLAILLLVDWLTIRSVVQLDSACCCRTSRTQLYCLFNSQFTTFTVNPFRQKRNSSLLRWVSTRNAKVDGLYLLTGFSASGQPLQKSLAPSGTTVRWVVSFAEGRVNCSVRQQTLLEIAQRCPDIHTAVVRCDEVEDWGECLVVSTKTLTRLTCLSLTGITVSRAQLATILSHCTQLQSLNVRSYDAVIPVDIALPTLKSLMAYSNSLSDEVLIAIGQRCATLQTLHMFKLSRWNAARLRISDVGVRAVLQGCPLLRDTDVEKAKDISPELRLEMARRRCYTDLKFYQWEGVTEVLARDILRVCPNLTHLNCKTCDGFTDAATGGVRPALSTAREHNIGRLRFSDQRRSAWPPISIRKQTALRSLRKLRQAE
jgi:hypothetical protein